MNEVMHNKILNNFFFNFFNILIVILIFILGNKKYTLALDPLIDKNILTNCSNPNNCVLETWKVSNANDSFSELIEILRNTPRVDIVSINEDYLHAISTSRVMKYVDDIEIKKYEKENILEVKSKSRIGFYDLGVNRRRINTLHFRLIDIYK